jgi:hypothetical protein
MGIAPIGLVLSKIANFEWPGKGGKVRNWKRSERGNYRQD